ncbi:MAG TPA: permease prefix domain 1-containing protein, partial [Bryobacteraceae bacterium]|nr:permease prefix domain 1-containing protein [Bryobacteraceae bacterium]
MKSWLSRLLRRIGRFRSDSDLEDELRVHLEMQAEDNLAAGMPALEAQRRARLRFGRTPAIIERVHDQDFMTILESWYRDFVLGMRAIRKSPVFCVTAILTLALGIGANTAIFALLYGLLLRSLPVTDPQQLAYIGLVSAGSRNSGSLIPYHMLEQLQREQHSFSAISAWWLGEVTMLDSEGTLRAYHV